MNKAYIAIIIAILLVAGSYVVYQNNNSTTAQKTTKTTLTKAQVENELLTKNTGFEQIGFLDFEVIPPVQNIPTGTTVKWTNYGELPQIVNAIGFKSPVLQTADSYEYTFNEPGEYNYFSDLRDFAILNGTIIVK